MSDRLSPASFLKHATDVATFYGFRSARDIERIAANRLVKRKGVSGFDTVAQACVSCVMLQPREPVLAYYATPQPMYLPGSYSPREAGEFGLQVVGSQESLGEVVMLKTIAAILTEWGAEVARVRINALGDKDSQQRFAREATNYVRKQAEKFDEICRERIAQNPLEVYRCSHESCKAILSEGPRSMTFLSEKSRTHFRSVLEYLESLSLPYQLDDLLLGDRREPHVAFAVDLKDGDATVLGAQGGRYDEFLKRHTGRKDGAGVAASIFFRKKGSVRSNFSSPHNSRAPKVYFVQLGTLAKLHGLAIIDMLRAARIPVSHSFDSSHLSPQLSAAKDLGVSHMLIMGQREAIDGTVIVRSTQNSSQTIVQIGELPRFLKTLRK